MLDIIPMPNLYFPICAFFIALLLISTYFSKKRVDNVETKIFTYMIIVSFIDTLVMSIMIFLGYLYGIQPISYILNIIDFWAILIWVWLFSLYIFHISFQRKDIMYKKFTNVIKITGIANLFIAIIISFSKIIPFYETGVMYAYGMAVDILYYTCGAYLLFIISSLLFNIKNIKDKKYTPLYVFIFIGALTLFIRQINPGLLLIPAVLAYINLIMYHTIENPDIKMVRKLNLANLNTESVKNMQQDLLKQMRHETNTSATQVQYYNEYNRDKAIEIIELIKTKKKISDRKLIDYMNEIIENTTFVDSGNNNVKAMLSNGFSIAEFKNQELKIDNKLYKTDDLIERIKSLVKYSISVGKKNIKFELNTAKLPTTLIGDYEQILRIIINLLENAFKFTDEGIVKLNLDFEEQSNNITYLTITVQDTGKGIKQENMSKLFKQFERPDFVDDQGDKRGVGLGLSIVKILAELMNGTVSAQSKYGQGSKFTVKIKQEATQGVGNEL